MPNIEKHAPGAFCWVELATSDQAAAIDFYSKIFGWSANNMPMGPNDFYTIFRLEGRDAAAGCTLRPEERSHGVPPHWKLYVAVDSADASAARAAELGGTVLAPPFADCDATAAAARNLGATLYVPPTDFEDVGRISIMADPQGAAFAIFKAAARGASGS